MSLAGVTVRLIQANELPQIVRLDRLSFAPLRSDTEIQQEWYDNSVELPGRRLFLAVEEATHDSIGSYAQVELGICFQGAELPGRGIAAVAVAPHRRGQRIAQLMLEHALEEARSQQVPLTMLYPFQHGFYRKLGWAWVGQTYQYRVAAQHIPVFPERKQIIPYEASRHEAALKAAYQQSLAQQNGWLNRQDWQWQARLKPTQGQEIYCYVVDGELQGYVVMQFVLLEPPKNMLAVVVREWVAPTIAAYRGIVGFLASLRDQVSTIIWNTDATDPFPHLLKEQRCNPMLFTGPFDFGLVHRFGELGGGFMWRLVDLKSAFRLRPIQPTAPFAVTFQVTDSILGDRTITAEFAEGQMHPTDQPASTVIRISIEHLTVLFSGFRKATDLLWTGEIEIEGDTTLLAHLDQAWQAKPPFCWDFF